MAQVPVDKKVQAVALQIAGMLRDTCGDDLITAVKAVALADQMFQMAFARTVNNFSGLAKRINKKGEKQL